VVLQACISSNAKDDAIEIDEKSFSLCLAKDSIKAYPYSSLEYKGHQRALRNDLMTQLKNKDIKFSDGYLFVSYYINCKGESGNFQVDGMDLNYKEKTFEKEILQSVQTEIENLSKWKLPYNKSGETLDAAYSITFKFKDDTIEKIIL